MINSKRGEVVSNGVKIVYWLKKYDNKKPTIFLHVGGGMNHTSLLKLEKELNKKGYSTITPDQRGTGESEVPLNPSKYSLKNYTLDLENILKKEKVKNPIFITQSFGFMPVVDYCAKTNNCQIIIGIGTSYNFSLGHSKIFMETTRTLELFIQKIIGKIYDCLHFFKKDKFENKNLSIYKSDIRYWLHFLKRTPKKRKANEYLANNNLKINLSGEIKNLKKPIFLICATKDQFIRKKVYKDFEKLGLKKFTYKIVKGTHSLPQSQPKKISKIILKYLSKKDY